MNSDALGAIDGLKRTRSRGVRKLGGRDLGLSDK